MHFYGPAKRRHFHTVKAESGEHCTTTTTHKVSGLDVGCHTSIALSVLSKFYQGLPPDPRSKENTGMPELVTVEDVVESPWEAPFGEPSPKESKSKKIYSEALKYPWYKDFSFFLGYDRNPMEHWNQNRHRGCSDENFKVELVTVDPPQRLQVCESREEDQDGAEQACVENFENWVAREPIVKAGGD
mmetsp:Transcript_3325/g.7801  ORF Transcript_3325/g.7801 Transcript_3325/m.7801 type:complete len:187 (-) Transcript_3325:138-698(-)